MNGIILMTIAMIAYMAIFIVHETNKRKPWASELSWFEGLCMGIVVGVVAMYIM